MANYRKYELPVSGKEILHRQEEPGLLRILLAQRRMYSIAKRWSSFRRIGVSLIAIAGPVVSVVCESTAVYVGAIAGVWLALGQTVFLANERKQIEAGAALQDSFDRAVFGIPESRRRDAYPAREDISRLTGPAADVESKFDKERLRGWYAVDPKSEGTRAVAIAQRSNVGYSFLLLRTFNRWAAVLFAVWLAFLLLLCIAAGMTLSTFILGVAFPVLPAFIDLWRLRNEATKHNREQEQLAKEMDASISAAKGVPIAPALLADWQDDLYYLRLNSPLVPDFLYWCYRARNESLMVETSNELSATMEEE